MNEDEQVEGEGAPADGVVVEARRFEKTPMFVAMHAQRYLRQALIRDIEDNEPDRTLLCYVAGNNAEVTRDDIVGFVDLLYNVQQGDAVDLLLHTGGGDLDAAEKLISLVRATIGEDAELRVIVPDYAKSAGTLMALGGNQIVMSDSSELGTIDPQVSMLDSCGHDIVHSVMVYIDAFERAERALDDDPESLSKRITFEKFDPTVLREFKAVRDRARQFAENQLKPRGASYTRIASDLMDINRFQSHRQMIDCKAARDLGLQVSYLAPTDPQWRRYWELYCHQRLAIGTHKKIFESAYVSLEMESAGSGAATEALMGASPNRSRQPPS